MKMRFLALLLALGLTTSMVGCQSAEKEAETSTATETQATAEADANTSATDEDIRVAFVLDCSGTDGSWGQANYEAAVNVKESMGFSDEQCIIMEQIDAYSPDAESVLEMLATDGYDLIFACSSGFTDAVSTVAARHPEVYFAQYEGGTAENTLAYSVRDYGAIFLCGYAVAQMSEQDQLGFIACQPQAGVIRALNAFSEGARYANADATVKVLWMNSWYDPAKEKEATNTLLSEGINAVGFYGGTTAVATACEEAGAYTNGFNVDMSAAGPNAVLTSFVWKWEPVFTQVIEMVQADQWSNETVFSSIQEGACDVVDFNADIMSAELIADCNAVREMVINGEIEVFEGPVYDNQGNCVLEEGEEFTIEDYVNMVFLLDNVVGELP
ncbi:MAG: BMP family ABC transporter substrate-binding protein [Eubacteriales bacterium]